MFTFYISALEKKLYNCYSDLDVPYISLFATQLCSFMKSRSYIRNSPLYQKSTVKAAPAQKPTVASVFNADDDDEPEEMPAEARMRMRNIGRETPTSAGPNSFGKTKQGFCDSKKIFEKTLKKAMEEANK